MQLICRSRSLAAISILSAGWLLAACTRPLPVTGLKPVYPPAESGRTSVDSMQPTFRWEALGPIEASGHARPSDRGVGAPRYDLKIWREKDGRPVELIYERQKLEINVHKLERPLQPDSHYVWTVRARFDLNGKPRVSPWSRTAPRRRTGVIMLPDNAYLPFSTPSADDPAPHKDVRP